MISTPTQTYMFNDGAVLITSAAPGACTCGRSAFLFINRDGVTACLDCDYRRLMVAPSETVATSGDSAQEAFNLIV
ncbi:MAG: hypothetical protein LAO20_16700 [Acidobacteriia bacterium]|nr:hypothetical protein [Terriglobia bacterium]